MYLNDPVKNAIQYYEKVILTVSMPHQLESKLKSKLLTIKVPAILGAHMQKSLGFNGAYDTVSQLCWISAPYQVIGYQK